MVLASQIWKVIFLVISFLPLWAGQAAAAGQNYQALSLDDCLVLARQYNPVLAASREKIQELEADYQAARSKFFPRLVLTSYYDRQPPNRFPPSGNPGPFDLFKREGYTGVLGKGGRQIETGFEYEASEGGSNEYGRAFAAVFSYGLTDSADLLLGVPWESRSAGGASERGPGDVSLEAKLLIGEKYGWVFLVKPGVSLPSGDEDKGLGAGKAQAWAYAAAGRTHGKWQHYLNAGLYHNANDADETKNVWKASAFTGYSLHEKVLLAADLAVEANTDKEASEHPATGMLGVVYYPAENLDLDLGCKLGLNDAAADQAVLAGVTYRF